MHWSLDLCFGVTSIRHSVYHLLRDAMHKHGLYRRAVSVCLSRSCILSKWINVSSVFFTSG